MAPYQRPCKFLALPAAVVLTEACRTLGGDPSAAELKSIIQQKNTTAPFARTAQVNSYFTAPQPPATGSTAAPSP
jgi:hypothetical protein